MGSHGEGPEKGVRDALARLREQVLHCEKTFIILAPRPRDVPRLPPYPIACCLEGPKLSDTT